MAEDRDEERDEVTTFNRLLLDAARNDNVEQLSEVFAKPGKFDINFQDGIGNTALHYAASEASLDTLNMLLEYEGCDVDYINRLEGATPLHLAVKIKEPELRAFIVDSLLDAGADMRIKDKSGRVALDYVPDDDTETRNAFRRHQAHSEISRRDVVEDYYEEDDEGEEGDDYTDSESDEE